jgi:site-specific DNA-methyltransferase (adenine-specific)
MDELICGDARDVMAKMPENSIDLTVTSPPYDDLRTYEGYKFDFVDIAKQLLRITKRGGVVVWIVGDAVINRSESGTSFRQALGFMEHGFKLHDTMIYKRQGRFPQSNRYQQLFEYMFVFSKGVPKTVNIVKDLPNKEKPRIRMTKHRLKDGSWVYKKVQLGTHHDKGNIWEYRVGGGNTSKDKIAFEHPAIFPEALARDHVLAWSNEGDIVLDPMCGSGTTCKVAKQEKRHYIGIDLSQNYLDIAKIRLDMVG